MSLWFTKQADGFQGWFAVVNPSGALRPGIPSGSFTATIIDPSDSTSITPTVTESSIKGGVYTFTIPSSFITTNGVGDYAAIVEITATAPTLRDVISNVFKVFVNDFDSIADSAIAASFLAIAGSSTIEVRTDATKADNFYDGMTLAVINSAGTVSRTIQSYSNTNGAFTLYSALPFTPAVNDKVIIVNSSELVSNIFVNSNLIPALL